MTFYHVIDGKIIAEIPADRVRPIKDGYLVAEKPICDYADSAMYCCLVAGHGGGHEGYEQTDEL